MKKNLVLVQPVASYNNDQPVLPQDAVGIGMLTIISYIKKFGYTGEIVHLPLAFSKGYNMDSVIEHIRGCNPEVIGIGLNWLHFSEGALETARKLHSVFPKKIIVIGGQHATLFAKDIVLACPYITGVTVGESEITYLRLLNAVNNGERIKGNVKGLAYVDNIGYHSSTPEIVENLDDIPFYSYNYVWPEVGIKCAAIDTVRGTCPKNCSYCIESRTNTLQGRKKFAYHSPEYLVSQIEAFVQEGIMSITIQDPITLLGEKYLYELCEGILRKNIKLKILNIFVEPKIFSYEFLDLLRKCADLVVLDYGIESGSEYVLEKSNREFSKKEILDNFKMATALGVRILTWWMVGMPGESQYSVDDTFRFMKETVNVGALPRWVTPLILFPQTDMANNAEKYGIKSIFKSFEDYTRFSQVPANKYGVYENLITHTPQNMTTKDIVEHTIALKKGIQALLQKNLDYLIDIGWSKENVLSIAQEVGGSFF